MTDRTAAELEKDAEAAREQVASTAESIRDRMSSRSADQMNSPECSLVATVRACLQT